LADGHEWEGGASTAKNGVTCNANIPTEEVFTTPHCRGSTATSSAPSHCPIRLADRQHRGQVRGSRIVEAKARAAEVLNKVLDTDEGAAGSAKWRWCRIHRRSRRAGCCSSTPVRRERRLPYRARPVLFEMFRRCGKLTPEQIAARAATRADPYRLDDRLGQARHRRHHADGRRVPVFRKGEWA